MFHRPQELLRDLLLDLRDAGRRLTRNVRYSLLIIVLMALGQGLAVTFFTLVDDVMLAPLPFRDAERLVHPWGVAERFDIDTYPYSWAGFVDYREGARTLEDLAATRTTSFTVNVDGTPRAVAGARVTPNLLALLGVEPFLGRGFAVDRERHDLGAGDEPRVAVVSHGYWRRRLAGSPDAVGSTLRIDGEPFVVIGVLPDAFRYPDPDTDVLIPLVIAEGAESLRGFHFLRMTGRLADGSTFAEAEAELKGIAARLAADYPEDHRDLGLRLLPLDEQVVGADARQGLSGLLAGAHVLFLVACINVSILLLVRTLTRRDEITLRSLLGAGGWSIARRASVENLLLMAVGCATGTGIAVAALRWIATTRPETLPRAHEVAVDLGTFGYAGLLLVVAGALFALLPIPQTLALIRGSMVPGGQRATAGGASRRLQGLLIAGQVSLALILAFCAQMFATSVQRMADVETGFTPESMLAAGLELPSAQFPTVDAQKRLVDRILAEARQLPGVESAGFFSRLPLVPGDASIVVSRLGEAGEPGQPNASYRVATPGWIDAMGVPLLEGRDFVAQDDDDPERRSVLVDQALARRLWPDRDAVGQVLEIGDQGQWTVVGVVGSLRLLRPDWEPRFTVYVTPTKNAFLMSMARPWLFLRARGDVAELVEPVRRLLRAAAPGQAILGIHTYDHVAGEWLRERRLVSALLLIFGGTSIFLAGAGLFAVVSFAVEQRQADFAIRAALGASPRRVAREVFQDGLRPVLAGGLVGGLVAGVAGMRLAPYLFATAPTDPQPVVTTAGILLIAVGAAILPAARRAAGGDPAAVLRPLGRRL